MLLPSELNHEITKIVDAIERVAYTVECALLVNTGRQQIERLQLTLGALNSADTLLTVAQGCAEWYDGTKWENNTNH